MKPRLRLARVGLTWLLLGWFSASLAAPSASLWQRWNTFDPESSVSIDHSPWHDWLGRFVTTSADGINRVAYGSVSPAERNQLKAYIADMTALQVGDYNRAQQRAYWINLYNALTVDIVLENYPLDSIRDISSGLFSSGPWRLKLAKIDGEKMTLDDIEHRILRPIWQDPRIHYAVNCASLGCPNLQAAAFTAENAESLLEASASEFINSPRGALMVSKKLRISRIYEWFEKDFGGNEAGVIKHLKRYAVGELATALETIANIDDYQYDWQINAR